MAWSVYQYQNHSPDVLLLHVLLNREDRVSQNNSISCDGYQVFLIRTGLHFDDFSERLYPDQLNAFGSEIEVGQIVEISTIKEQVLPSNVDVNFFYCVDETAKNWNLVADEAVSNKNFCYNWVGANHSYCELINKLNVLYKTWNDMFWPKFETREAPYSIATVLTSRY